VSCVRDAEGGGERSEPPALPCGHCERDKHTEGGTKCLEIVITVSNKATRIVRRLSFLSRCSRMCLNYHLSTFAEANAKPEAARPEPPQSYENI
jgi:hypothetical protein